MAPRTPGSNPHLEPLGILEEKPSNRRADKPIAFLKFIFDAFRRVSAAGDLLEMVSPVDVRLRPMSLLFPKKVSSSGDL